MKKIGFTSSFPVETVFAAGMKPVDLNNIFITGKAAGFVESAEFDGFPRNVCAWIKGLYSVGRSEFDTIVGITGGDCSNTHSLMSLYQEHGVEVIPFSFPYEKNREELDREISRLEARFGIDRMQTEFAKQRLDKIRKRLIELDRMTWQDGVVTGCENHFWLVNSSDFEGDPDDFETRLNEFIVLAARRKPEKDRVRLGFIGVPPIIDDLYDFLEKNGARIVFNEVQRQFAMPYLEEDILDQYLHYTYPYTVFDRLQDITQEIERRKLDGIISYTQAFCHRQIDNIVLKRHIDIPTLTLEADRPGSLDSQARLRIESFLEML